MADHDIPDVPCSPDEMDWRTHYPKYFSGSSEADTKAVTIADIGCGFGGLSVKLAAMFPDQLVLGMEIRCEKQLATTN